MDVNQQPASNSSSRPLPRRPVQACASCKKSKVRCEIIDLPDLEQDVKCHRCTVLRYPCTFTLMDKALFVPYVSKPSPQTPPEFPINPASPAAPFLQTVLEREALLVRPPSMGYGSPDPDVVAQFKKSPWTFRNTEFDWNEPLRVMQEVMRYRPSSDTPLNLPSTPDLSLDAILSREQIDQLLEVFAVHYVPWLNFSLLRDSSSPVLEMVCCTVAARHLSAEFRALVSARLQRLTDDTIAKLIFNSSTSQSLETIQALLILASWCPVGSMQRDGRVLIASAVSIALNMRLNEASAKVLQKQASSDANVADLRNKARLWMALANVESMLCIGTLRTPLTSRSPADINFIPLMTLSPDTLTECRDARLRLLGEMFNAVEIGSKLELNNESDLENWYDAIMRVFGTMDRLRRLILPLEVLADHDQFYFHMLLIQLHCCRLQLLYRAMYSLRTIFHKPNTFWFLEVKPHGISVMTTWGRECLQLSEAVLVATLQTDPQNLSSCPDPMIYMIAFAADLAFATKCYIRRHMGLQMNGSVDKLLKRVMQHFASAAPSLDHPASACATFLSAMLASEDEFIKHGHAIPLFPARQVPDGLDEPPPAHPSQPLENAFQDVQFWTQFFGYDPSDGIESQFVQPQSSFSI